MFCLLVHMCTTHIPGACRGQKRSSDSLELELWVVVNQHVGTESWVWNLSGNKFNTYFRMSFPPAADAVFSNSGQEMLALVWAAGSRLFFCFLQRQRMPFLWGYSPSVSFTADPFMMVSWSTVLNKVCLTSSCPFSFEMLTLPLSVQSLQLFLRLLVAAITDAILRPYKTNQASTHLAGSHSIL